MRVDSLYGDGSSVQKKTSVSAQQNLRAKTAANALVSSALQRQTKNQIASDLSPQTQKQEQVQLKKAQTQTSAQTRSNTGTSSAAQSTLTPETAYNLFVPPALSTAPAVPTASSSPSDRMAYVVGLLTNPLTQNNSTSVAEPSATAKDWSDMTGKERIDALVAAQAAQAGASPSGLFLTQENTGKNSGSGLDSGTDSAYAGTGTENESPQVVTPLDKLSEAADSVSSQAPYGQGFKDEAADLADAFADIDATYRDYAAKTDITTSDEKALNQLQNDIADTWLKDGDPNSLSCLVAKDYFDLFGDLEKKGPIAKAVETALYPAEKFDSGMADGSVGVIGSGVELLGNLLSGGKMDRDFSTLDAYFAANPDALQDLVVRPDQVAQKTGVSRGTVQIYTVANAGKFLDATVEEDASSLPSWYKDTVGTISYGLGQQTPAALLTYLCGVPAEGGAGEALDGVLGDAGDAAGDAEKTVADITEGAGELPKYPGSDPYKQPSPDYEWRGDPQKGSWYNPQTQEVLRSDIEHGDPIGPHWDYRGSDGKWYRLFPDGSIEPKS